MARLKNANAVKDYFTPPVESSGDVVITPPPIEKKEKLPINVVAKIQQKPIKQTKGGSAVTLEPQKKLKGWASNAF